MSELSDPASPRPRAGSPAAGQPCRTPGRVSECGAVSWPVLVVVTTVLSVLATGAVVWEVAHQTGPAAVVAEPSPTGAKGDAAAPQSPRRAPDASSEAEQPLRVQVRVGPLPSPAASPDLGAGLTGPAAGSASSAPVTAVVVSPPAAGAPGPGVTPGGTGGSPSGSGGGAAGGGVGSGGGAGGGSAGGSAGGGGSSSYSMSSCEVSGTAMNPCRFSAEQCDPECVKYTFVCQPFSESGGKCTVKNGGPCTTSGDVTCSHDGGVERTSPSPDSTATEGAPTEASIESFAGPFAGSGGEGAQGSVMWPSSEWFGGRLVASSVVRSAT